MEVWRIAQGSAESRTVPVVDSDGNPIAYGGTETLAAKLWIGLGQPALLSLVPTWLDPAAGTTTVALSAAQTAALSLGQYRLLCTVTDGGGAHDYFEAVVAIVPSPGVTATRPTYIDATDLRKVCAWIEDVQDPEQQETGFADQCADARDWLDENIIRNYRGGNISLLGYHGLALDAWYTGGVRRTSLTNIWLRDQLAANCLIVSPRVRRVCALYACHLVFDAQTNRGKEYQALAAKYLHQAHALLASTVCELSLNRDGTPNVPSNMSSTNTLMG